MKNFNRFQMGSLMEEAPAAGSGTATLPPVAAPQPDPAVQRLQTELQRSKQDVETLRRQIFSTPAPQPAAAPSAPAPTKADINREFIKDPTEYSMAIATRVANETINRTMGPAYETMVEQARQLARGEDPEMWDRFQAEIQANVDMVEPHLKTNVNVWKNSFRMVKGAHLSEIVEAARAKPNSGPGIIIRDGGGPTHSNAAAPAQPKEAITPEEHRVAQKFRISDEEYLRSKKANLSQTDFILNPLGPSSWDEHVTFDSRDTRAKKREELHAARAANKTGK